MIYLIQPEGRPVVKIGYAKCVELRLEGLQVASPDELVVLGVMPGTSAKEGEVHSRFAHLHIRGEWFRYTREVRRFIERETVRYDPEVHDPVETDAAGREEWKASLAAVEPADREPGRRVRVWVQAFQDRNNLVLQWIDPATRRRRSKSAGTKNADEAEVRRADLETLLNLTDGDPLRNGPRNSTVEEASSGGNLTAQPLSESQDAETVGESASGLLNLK